MTRAAVLAALAGVAVALAVGELVAARRAAGTRRTAAGARARRVARLLARVGRGAGLPLPTPADLGARIQAAGLPDRVTAGDVMAVKAGAAVAAAAASLPIALGAPGRSAVLLLIAVPAGAFLVPDAWLASRARRRATAIATELADVLELLRVALAAGLAPARGLREIGRHRGGVLAHELAATAARIDLGERRADAYARLRARCPSPVTTTLTAALERADAHGASLEEPLRSLALDARAEEARALQERAARAAPKIQLVVALVLVPAVLLLVGAALLTRVT